MAPRPLLAVELVFRDKAAFAGLPHAIALVNEFLDSSVELTLAAACKFGSRKLLHRIWDSCSETRDDSTGGWSIRNYLRTDRNYLQFQFRQSLLEAVKTGDELTVEWLFQHCADCDVPVKVVGKAAELGRLEILKFFHKAATGRANLNSGGRHRMHWGGKDAEKAARNGHSNVVWWLLVHAPAQRNSGYILSAAVESGDVPLMDWLMRSVFNRRQHSRPRISSAVWTGSLEVVRWMYNHGFVDGGVEALMDAASNDDLEIVSWLLEHKKNVGLDSYGAFNSAITNHSLNCAKYLDEHFDVMEVGRCFEETMLIAAREGELEAVQWLVEEFGDDPDIDLFETVHTLEEEEPRTVLDAAAQNGKLEIVQYLHELDLDMKAWKHKRRKSGEARRRGGTWRGRGVTCTAEAMDRAAQAGNIEIVLWLHHNRPEGCTTDAMDSAAGEGFLAMVKWLHRNRTEGCTAAAMDAAAGSGYLDVVKWLHKQRSEGCTTNAMETAAENGDLHVVKWLSKPRNEGCTTNAMDKAAANGHLEVVKWLHYNRSEGCTTKAIDGAAGGGFLKVVRWLHSNRSEGWTSAALTRAAVNAEFKVLLFLHSEQTEDCSYSFVGYDERNYNGEFEVLPEIRAWALENSPP